VNSLLSLRALIKNGAKIYCKKRECVTLNVINVDNWNCWHISRADAKYLQTKNIVRVEKK
jgi:hypothetical protein